MTRKNARQPRHATALILLLLTPVLTQADEIEIVESWPTCEFERLGDVEAADGKRITPGSGGSRRANVERAEGRLRRSAKKLGATRIVLTKRYVQRDGDRARYVELRGTAIGSCASGS